MTATKEVSRALFDRVMTPNYAPAPCIPVRGEGSRVWDQSGKDYVDFAGGIAVTCLGHAHPRLIEALTEQAGRLWHVSNLMTNEPALRLAAKLCAATFAERVFFANSGAEANEAALKLARRYAADHFAPDKREIVSFCNAFHGRTLFTVSVGGQPKYTEGFGPLPGGITHLPYGDVDDLARHVSARTCAVIMEPIQGEGGVVVPSPEFLQCARAICDRHEALLVLDEVQTGMGRTGRLYAYMGLGVTPDILTTAKGLGGGFPVAAMLTTAAVAESFGIGTHGSTYGGNALACAVAEAVFDIVNDDDFLVGVGQRHDRLCRGLEAIKARYGLFREVRGSGLLLGCVLDDAWQGAARRLLTAAREAGLLVLVAGSDVVRLAPALNIPLTDLDEGLERFERAVQSLITESIA